MEKRETLNKNNAVLISYANAFKNDLIEKRRHNQKHFFWNERSYCQVVCFFYLRYSERVFEKMPIATGLRDTKANVT